MAFDSPIPNLWDREMEFVELFNIMESRGVGIDVELAKQEIAIGEGRMNQLRKELNGYNPRSNKDLHTLLIDEMKLPVLKEHLTDKGKPSFDKAAMKTYEAILANNPEYTGGQWGSVAQNILEYRGWGITLALCYKKFVELLSPDGRLRCNYKLHGTKTSRTSCEHPNLQQIPKDMNKIWNRNMKKTFITQDEDYVLLQADFSQGESRLAAGYAQQPNLIKVFTEGHNMWDDMTQKLGRPKTQCKTLQYAKMYGAGRAKLRLILGGDDPDKFIDDWEEYNSDIVAFSEEVYKTARRRKYVYLWTGRIRHTGWNPELAFNSLLQGGLAEIVKSAMLRLRREVDSDLCRILLMVHDSVIFEIHRSILNEIIPKIHEVMSRVQEEKDFGVPFTVEHEMWGRDAA